MAESRSVTEYYHGHGRHLDVIWRSLFHSSVCFAKIKEKLDDAELHITDFGWLDHGDWTMKCMSNARLAAGYHAIALAISTMRLVSVRLNAQGAKRRVGSGIGVSSD